MRYLGLAMLLALTCGCAKVPPALIAGQPTRPQVQQVQRIAGQVADGATLTLEVAQHAGMLLDALPLDAATKDTYDCAILRVTGINAPSPTVTKVCGKLPTLTTSPMTFARARLQSLTTCPSLRATTALVLGSMQPFVEQLRAQPSLAFLALSLTATIDFAKAVLEGGISCQ